MDISWSKVKETDSLHDPKRSPTKNLDENCALRTSGNKKIHFST